MYNLYSFYTKKGTVILFFQNWDKMPDIHKLKGERFILARSLQKLSP